MCYPPWAYITPLIKARLDLCGIPSSWFDLCQSIAGDLSHEPYLPPRRSPVDNLFDVHHLCQPRTLGLGPEIQKVSSPLT